MDNIAISLFTDQNLNWFDRIINMSYLISQRPEHYSNKDIDRLAKLARGCDTRQRVFEVGAVMLLGDAHQRGHARATRWLREFVRDGGLSHEGRRHAENLLYGVTI